jgi:hypothetical protein
MDYNGQGYAITTKGAWRRSIFLNCRDPLAAADEAPFSLLERVRDGRATMEEALEKFQCPDVRKPNARKAMMHGMAQGETDPTRLMANVVSKIKRFKTVSIDTEAEPAVKNEPVKAALVCAGFPDGTAYVFDRRKYEAEALGRHWSWRLSELWSALNNHNVTVVGSNVSTDLRGSGSYLDCVCMDTQLITTFMRKAELLPWENMDLHVDASGLKILPAMVYGHHYGPVYGAKAYNKKLATWKPHGKNAPVRFAQLPTLKLMNSMYGWLDWTMKTPSFGQRRKIELQQDYVLNDVAASPWLHVAVLGYYLGVAGYKYLLPSLGEKVEDYVSRLSAQLRDGQMAWPQLPRMRSWSRREISPDDPLQLQEHDKVVLDWGGQGVSSDGIDWTRVDAPFASMQMAHEISCATEFALDVQDTVDSAAKVECIEPEVDDDDIWAQYRSGKEVTHGFGPPGVDYEGDARELLTPRPSRALSDLAQASSSDVDKGGSDSKGILAATTAKARAKVVSKLVQVECELMKESGVDVNAMTAKQKKERAVELRKALKQARKKLKERGSSLVVSSLVPTLLDASKLRPGFAKRADGKLVPYYVDPAGRRPTQPVGINKRELAFSYPSRMLPRTLRAAPRARRTCGFCGQKSHRPARSVVTVAEKDMVRQGYYKYCPRYKQLQNSDEEKPEWQKQCCYPLCTSDSVIHDTGACPDIGRICKLCQRRGHGRLQCQEIDEDELKTMFLAHKEKSQFQSAEFQFETDDRSELEWVVFDRDGAGDDDVEDAEFRGVYMTPEQLARWLLCDTKDKRKEFVRELYGQK